MKFILIFFFKLSANAQNCDGFEEGVFEVKGNFGTLIIERKDNWQLEKSLEYGLIYLNKSETIGNCKYRIIRYKILESGAVPEPDMTTTATTEIVEVSENKYYFKSSLDGTDMVMENNFTKISDEIGEEFRKIIADEK